MADYRIEAVLMADDARALELVNEAEAYFTELENHSKGKDAPRKQPLAYKRLPIRKDLVLCARDADGKTLGVIVLEKYHTSCPVVILNYLYVREVCRRKGIATALAKQAIGMIHGEGRHAELAILANNSAAEWFWCSLGFRLRTVATWYYMD